MIIYIILIVIAAALNAVMDLTENIVAFNKSAFRYKDKRFWCKDVSWQYAIKVFGWKADVWHISKSLMIIVISLALIAFKSIGHWSIDILLFGAIWIVSFNLFYNKLLR